MSFLPSPGSANAKAFGAVGNGSSNPASSRFGTLTALQAVYGTTVGGVTIALTNELDWLAHQKMIDTLHAASGGDMYSPTGKYVYSNANSVSDGSGTLLWHETGTVDAGTLPGGVNWYGDGFNSTLHTWPSDLGNGRFAVTCTNRLNTVTGSVGYWRDMAFVGPNNAVALGAKPANMHGLGWSEYRLLNQIRVDGFNGGICVNAGGQTPWDTVYGNNCFYFIYYDATNAMGDHGDQTFKNLSGGNCTKAVIGVANTTHIISTHFIKFGAFTSPYAIFKETGGADTTVLEDVLFDGCSQFEQLGNGILSDGLAAGAHTAITVGNVTFVDPEWTQNNTYKLAGVSSSAVIGIGSNLGPLEIRGFANLGGWAFTNTPNGIIEIDSPGGILLRGDLTTLFANMAGVAPIGTGFWNNFNFVLENTGLFQWTGFVAQANGTLSTLAVGNVLAANGTANVLLSAGNTTEQIAGICVMTNMSVSGGAVCVANKGYVPVVTAGTNVIANGTLCRAAASGLAVTSSGQFQTTSKNLGIWQFGSGASPNLVAQVLLQGLA